jgi:hypothetical protein
MPQSSLYFLLFLSTTTLAISGSVCPVSAVLNQDIALPHRYHYPEIYFPQSNFFEEELYFNCSTRDSSNAKYIQARCFPPSFHRQCPFSEEQSQIALSLNPLNRSNFGFCSWKQHIAVRHRLRRLTSHLQRPIVNVVVFGGSMTQGSRTNGLCCCFQHNGDSRCPIRPKGQDICHERFCSWATPFFNWLTSQFPMIDVRVHHKGYGGVSSRLSPSIVGKFLRSIDFSPSDFIFLDYSVNDAHACCLSVPDLGSDVEHMIRRLFLATKTKPTIVMIEQYPHSGKRNISLEKDRPYELRLQERDYAHIYRTLSQHYGLVYWTMREVYWSNLNLHLPLHQRYPLNVSSALHENYHPEWYVHLFMADAMASLFLKEMASCRNSPVHQSTLTLPPPYYPLSHGHQLYCYFGGTMLLQYLPHQTVAPSLEALQQGWSESGDHRSSGCIVTNVTLPAGWTLSLPFETVPQTGKTYEHYLVATTYLQSYENMGAVEIGVCGRRTGVVIDGLNLNQHVSIPDVHRYELSLDDSTRCLSLSVEKRALQYHYLGDQPPDHREVRGMRKFKLLSVDVCEKEHEDEEKGSGLSP